MSLKTRLRRELKEKKRLLSTYVCPVKPKPREVQWRAYRSKGVTYGK